MTDLMTRFVRLTPAYRMPWWPEPSSGVNPAEIEYIGPWPDGGTGVCVRRFHADTVEDSNRQALAFKLALEVADRAGVTVEDAGEFWRIAA